MEIEGLAVARWVKALLRPIDRLQPVGAQVGAGKIIIPNFPIIYCSKNGQERNLSMKYISMVCFMVVVIIGSTMLVHAPEKEPGQVPDYAKLIRGCWQNDEDKNSLCRFEAGKCIMFNEGQLSVARANYEAGKLILRMQGVKIICDIEIKDNTLMITTTIPVKKTVIWHKLDKVPPELDLNSLHLGKIGDLPTERIKAIQSELAKRLELDQSVRNPEVLKKGMSEKDMEKMAKVDTDNTAYLKKLVSEIGWINAKRFGSQTALAAFVIVQHSADIRLMLAVIPFIRQDVDNKLTDAQDYALLYDRLQEFLGDKQRYGTQLREMPNGEYMVSPLENREKVDEFRKELGLEPLSKYLEGCKKTYGVKDIKIMEEED